MVQNLEKQDLTNLRSISSRTLDTEERESRVGSDLREYCGGQDRDKEQFNK